MRGSRGPRGFPHTITRQLLGSSGSTAYDLPHKGVHMEGLIGYDGTTVEAVALVRGTGTNGADQVVFAASTVGSAYASYTYTPGR